MIAFVLLLGAARGPDALHKKAVDAFDRAEFKRAAELLLQDLEYTAGTPREKETRKLLVLSLYNSKQTEASIDAYRALTRRFTDFKFDEGEVLPDTIAFFERRAQPATQPRIIETRTIYQPASQPADPKRWHWSYLAPLGIGQFLAGSPVRGATFLLLTASFIATNIAGYAIYAGQIEPDGLARNANRARTGLVITNLGFAGIVASVAAGVIDALVFEP